jgi:hypothetical protein
MACTGVDVPILEGPWLLYQLANVSVTVGLESEHHIKHAEGAMAAVSHPVPRCSWRPGMNLAHDQKASPNGEIPSGIGEWPSGITSGTLEMNCDETVDSLVGQREIDRMAFPCWIPNAWAHQASHDHAPKRGFYRRKLSGWVKACRVCWIAFCISSNAPGSARGSQARAGRKIYLRRNLKGKSQSA